jgi:hypothetical protein
MLSISICYQNLNNTLIVMVLLQCSRRTGIGIDLRKIEMNPLAYVKEEKLLSAAREETPYSYRNNDSFDAVPPVTPSAGGEQKGGLGFNNMVTPGTSGSTSFDRSTGDSSTSQRYDNQYQYLDGSDARNENNNYNGGGSGSNSSANRYLNNYTDHIRSISRRGSGVGTGVGIMSSVSVASGSSSRMHAPAEDIRYLQDTAPGSIYPPTGVHMADTPYNNSTMGIPNSGNVSSGYPSQSAGGRMNSVWADMPSAGTNISGVSFDRSGFDSNSNSSSVEQQHSTPTKKQYPVTPLMMSRVDTEFNSSVMSSPSPIRSIGASDSETPHRNDYPRSAEVSYFDYEVPGIFDNDNVDNAHQNHHHHHDHSNSNSNPNNTSTEDISFDCEVTFQQVYRPSHPSPKSRSETSKHLSGYGGHMFAPPEGTKLLVSHPSEVFHGVNHHFKDSELEARARAAATRVGSNLGGGGGSHSNSGASNSTSNSGACDTASGSGSGTDDGKKEYFTLDPDDAMKLGEMLYILRPLIYAVIQQQIGVYKAQQQRNSTQASDTAAGSNRGDTSVIVSPHTVTSVLTPPSASLSSTILTTVLDVFSLDNLLNVLALVVSFVTELLSIHLTQYALQQLRKQCRDASFHKFELQLGAMPLPRQPVRSQQQQHNLMRTNSFAPQEQNSPPSSSGCSERQPVDSNGDGDNDGDNGVVGSSDESSVHAVHGRDRARALSVYHNKVASVADSSSSLHAFDRELSRRRFALFLYLIRSPIFDR